ncbi:MAG: YgjV family protein [Alphaproteobacteria bacterium]|nr:YgjV family protein [Alphaproteobacteria bacterium]
MSTIELIAVGLFIFGGLLKAPRKTIGIYTISNFLLALVYLQAALYMAFAAITVSCIRSIAALFLTYKQNKYSVIITTLTVVGLIAVEISHMTDILVLISAVAIGTSIYFRDNLVMYRLLSITSNTVWIIHSLVFGVYGMLICASIVVCTSIWVLYKHSDLKSIKSEILNSLLFLRRKSA